MGGAVITGAGGMVSDTAAVLRASANVWESCAGMGISPLVQRVKRYSSPANITASSTASRMILPFLISAYLPFFPIIERNTRPVQSAGGDLIISSPWAIILTQHLVNCS